MKIIRLHIYDNIHRLLDQSRLPFGVNLTKWINSAMQEKLDRDSGSTIGVTPPGSDELEEHKPVDAFAILAEMKKQEARKNPLAIGPYSIRYAGTPEYRTALMNHRSKGAASLGVEGELELFVSQIPTDILTEEEKREIMAEHGRKQAQAVKAPPVEVDLDAIPDEVRGHKIKYREWRDKRDAEKAGAPLPEVSETGELSDTAEYLALAAKPAPVEVSPLVNVASEPEDFWGADDDGYAKIKRKAQSRI